MSHRFHLSRADLPEQKRRSCHILPPCSALPYWQSAPVLLPVRDILPQLHATTLRWKMYSSPAGRRHPSHTDRRTAFSGTGFLLPQAVREDRLPRRGCRFRQAHRRNLLPPVQTLQAFREQVLPAAEEFPAPAFQGLQGRFCRRRHTNPATCRRPAKWPLFYSISSWLSSFLTAYAHGSSATGTRMSARH